MTTQTTSITSGSMQDGHSRWLAGAPAALTLAVGVTTWQTGGREATKPAPSVPTTQEASTSATVVAGSQSATVYLLVETADDVPAARARLVELNRLREGNGANVLDATIVVTGNDEVVAQLQQAVRALAAVREAEGLPPIQLIDQRTGGAMAWAPAMTSGCGLETQTRAC